MKKIFVAIFSVAFVLALMIPVNAWFHPGAVPTDDLMHNQFGPMTPNLLCIPYGTYELEYTAFKAGLIDFMDWSLLAPSVAELNTMDPTMATYARAFFTDRGMREFDINCMKFPTSNVDFRKALAHCFDKDTFVATQLAGLGMKMDTPLQWSAAWANPYCTGLYPYNLQSAVDKLKAANFTDKNADGWIEGPGGEAIKLIIYVRSDDPDRSAMGQIFATTINTKLSLQDWSPYTAANINIDLKVAPKTECFQKVMVEFAYHIYTGGWSFGRDPDTLYFLYLGDYAQAFPYTPNYAGFDNAEFDTNAELWMTASAIGDPTTPGTAMYHMYKMQEILADEVGVIPVFTYASYGGYKTGWEKVVNAEGVGPWSWWTMLNAHKTATDTIRWGFMNDVESLNPIHSEWVWDWQILDKVYDTLITYDPYEITRDKPWMATSWHVGEWLYGGEPATYVEFKLREDMYWHDIAPKADRKTPDGKPLLQAGAYNKKVTADDVIFSIIMVRDIEDSWNNALVADVAYAEAPDPYTVKVYFKLFMPLVVTHWVGGLPIVPKHVWEPIYKERNTREFNPIAEKCLSGCGPWKFDYAASSMHNYYMLRADTRYFRYHPVDVIGEIDSLKITQPCNDVTVRFYLHNQDFQRTIPASSMRVTIQKHYPNCTWVTLYNQSIPDLPPCEKISILNYTEHISAYGLYEFKATITADPLTGHADMDGYTIYVWSTIPEDLNLDIYVGIDDIVYCAEHFGGAPPPLPGHERWDVRCDLNKDNYIGIDDIVNIAEDFGRPP